MAISSVCGIILLTDTPKELADFYSTALDVRFEREDHGDLKAHFGVDLGQTHFGIHPPQNFRRPLGRGTKTAVVLAVDSLAPYIERLNGLNAPLVAPPHDAGFGLSPTYADPEGNLLELVELTYAFVEK